jgi:transglutaminase-like putative cysteine protease
MLIRIGYDIQFEVPTPVPMIAVLHVHPTRETYIDSYGNRCSRFLAPAGLLKLSNLSLIEDSGLPDPIASHAREIPVDELPHDTLRYLLNSRYCEVDRLSNIAAELFGGVSRGWNRVQAVSTWVHEKVSFGYHHARSTKTALDVFTERTGVCRDFQHLAITFCRALNIPARYATGYLGDIGIPPVPGPMDFSAWFEVYLEGRWWACDARHNRPRIGRILMATGLDASDVAITTSFGIASLSTFTVITDEVTPEAVASPLALG